MQILGIHAQGLRAPKGVHRLLLDSGYSAIVAPNLEEAQAMARLLFALIYPRSDLDENDNWKHHKAREPARAGLSFELGRQAYRLIVDFDGDRLVLGRYDTVEKDFKRISTNRIGVEAHLKGIGLPGRDEFFALSLCQPERLAASAEAAPVRPQSEPPLADERSQIAAERVRLTQEIEAAEEAVQELAKSEARAQHLREARDRFEVLERDYKRVVAELEERAVLRDAIDTLDVKLHAFRDLCDERASERAEIEHTRREFLDDRSQLRTIPTPLALPLVLGLLLAVAGSTAGAMGYQIFYLLGGIGFVAAFAAFFIARRARWRLGSVEARLAALRVRERSVERKFESETSLVRGLMQALEVETADDLAREARNYRALLDRANALKRELGEVKLVFSDETASELQDLERRVTEGRTRAADPAALRTALERLPEVPEPEKLELSPAEPEPASHGPDALVRAAAAAVRRSEAEICEVLPPTLSLYLRSLTHGELTQGRRTEPSGWAFRGEQAESPVPFENFPVRTRIQLEIAFRFALIEALAPEFPIPMLVGPNLPLDTDEDQLNLARMLQRLSEVVQVVQITDRGEPWVDHASRTIELS